MVQLLSTGFQAAAPVLNKTIGIHLVDFEYFKDERYARRLVFKDAETNEYHESLGYLERYFIEMTASRSLVLRRAPDPTPL